MKLGRCCFENPENHACNYSFHERCITAWDRLDGENVADQKYIVVGYDTSSIPHNYYAVPWPQGYMGEENMYLVGLDDIAKVLCRGGINEESRVFLQALDDVLNGR